MIALPWNPVILCRFTGSSTGWWPRNVAILAHSSCYTDITLIENLFNKKDGETEKNMSKSQLK